MRQISENTVIQIDVTNACHLSCRHCTRHVGHHRKPYFMELDFIEKSIESLLDSPCRIGLMGGEPNLHPKFREILKLWRDLVPIEKREFWTAGFKWGEYKDEIYETFWRERISYNDHVAYDGKHAPLLIAIDEVVDDPELKKTLIENCPYQSHWSAAITPKGGFFCEIAASMDWLFDGPGGYDVEPGWWDRTPEQFQDQIDRYCGACSGALSPFTEWMGEYSDARGGRIKPAPEAITPGNVERLKAVGSAKIARGEYELWDKKFTQEDMDSSLRNPRAYRSFEAHGPEDVRKALEESNA